MFMFFCCQIVHARNEAQAAELDLQLQVDDKEHGNEVELHREDGEHLSQRSLGPKEQGQLARAEERHRASK